MSALKICPHSSSTNSWVGTEPVESAVQRQGMGLAVKAQPAQEQHHPCAGGEPQLLSGMQPLLLATIKSSSPVEGFRDQCPEGSVAAGDPEGLAASA